METIKERIYTLTQLNQSIENLISKQLGFRKFWIKCQIAKINTKGGHHYLELMDSTGGQKTAVARGIIWRLTYADIQKEFAQLGLRMEEVLKPDMEITVQVAVNFHKLYGMSLNIEKMDPNAIIGDIEQQKRETLQRLQKEGLLDMQKRLYLGPINKKIALVGSPDTSGFNDFVKELTSNELYTGFTFKVFEASVQGDAAVSSLEAAISEANKWDVDAIVVIRGGGSKMDLHVFNHYNVCKAIAYSRVPVVVGIGHETDQVLADRVAYHSEKTPTAAAKFFYLSIGIFSGTLSEALQKIKREAQAAVYETRQETQMYQKRIYQGAEHLLKNLQNTIVDTQQRLNTGATALLVHHRDHITTRLANLYTKATDQLNHGVQHLQQTLQGTLSCTQQIVQFKRDEINELRLGAIAKALNFVSTDQSREIDQTIRLVALRTDYVMRGASEELGYLEKKLDLVNPQQLFEKGYTISTVDGKDLNTLEDDNLEGKTMTTFAQNTKIESTITKVSRHD